MPAKSVSVVDALVTFLNGLSLSQAFTATKQQRPSTEAEDVDGLTVFVSSGPETWERAARSGMHQVAYQVLVVVKDRGEDNDAIDAHLLLVEEIKDAVAPQSIDNLPCTEIEQDEPYDSELLQIGGQLSTTIQFTFRGFK